MAPEMEFLKKGPKFNIFQKVFQISVYQIVFQNLEFYKTNSNIGNFYSEVPNLEL